MLVFPIHLCWRCNKRRKLRQLSSLRIPRTAHRRSVWTEATNPEHFANDRLIELLTERVAETIESGTRVTKATSTPTTTTTTTTTTATTTDTSASTQCGGLLFDSMALAILVNIHATSHGNNGRHHPHRRHLPEQQYPGPLLCGWW